MKISPELRALLKVAPKAHPELQATLVDLMMYKPTLLVGETAQAPDKLGMEQLGEPTAPQLEVMRTAETALWQPIHLPATARFSPGTNIHVQFDGGAQDGHGTGGFVVLVHQQREIV